MIDNTFLTAFGHRLTQMIQTEDDPRDTKDEKVTIFHGAEVPEINLGAYLERIAQYSEMEVSEFIVGMLYLRRIRELHPHFPCSHRSIHRTILTLLLVTTKMYRDCPLSNEFYAVVGGISMSELARLERCILELLEYRLFVSVDEYTSEAADWNA